MKNNIVNLKLISGCLFVFFCGSLLTVSSAEELKNSLTIQAIPLSEGTVVVKGKPKYEKTFKLVVLNDSDKQMELTGTTGCYKAFNDMNSEFEERTVQLDLLGTLKKGMAKEGEITFTGDDKSVYSANFVKWSTSCNH